MAKRKVKDPTIRQVGETHLQWQSRLSRNDQNQREHGALISDYAAQHSQYAANDDGSRTNIGGTPLARWKANKMLDITHEAAIAYCIRLWDLLATEPRLTANYGENVGGGANNHESGRMILARMEAQEDLERICGKRDEYGVLVRQGYIPAKYWATFENCIRHDEPAGVSGSRFSAPTQTAKTRAHTVVCFVADLICEREGLAL
jgi:hypothetical protein